MATTGALLLGIAGLNSPVTASTPVVQREDLPVVADGASLELSRRQPAGSRTLDRQALGVDVQDEVEPSARPTIPAALEVAAAALESAAARLATESSTSPQAREQVISAATIVRELVALADNDEKSPDPETAAAVDAALAAAAVDMGEPERDTMSSTKPVLALAITKSAQSLQEILDSAEAPGITVTPRPRTAADVLREQIAAGRADADRLNTYGNSTAGFQNGRLPREVMTDLPWAAEHRQRVDAAAQLERLNLAFRAQFGTDLEVTDSYRSLEGQIRAREEKGSLAATPGTSNHGWAIAVDLGTGINGTVLQSVPILCPLRLTAAIGTHLSRLSQIRT